MNLVRALTIAGKIGLAGLVSGCASEPVKNIEPVVQLPADLGAVYVLEDSFWRREMIDSHVGKVPGWVEYEHNDIFETNETCKQTGEMKRDVEETADAETGEISRESIVDELKKQKARYYPQGLPKKHPCYRSVHLSSTTFR